MQANLPRARYVVYRTIPKLFYTEKCTWSETSDQAASLTYSEALLLLEKMRLVDPKNQYNLEFTGIEPVRFKEGDFLQEGKN